MTVLPKSVLEHIQIMQHSANVAESLVDAIVACGDDPRRGTLVITLAEAAQEVLQELGRGLDMVEIEKVTA